MVPNIIWVQRQTSSYFDQRTLGKNKSLQFEIKNACKKTSNISV